MTRISAIIPSYNAERYLAEAIESVLQQTTPVDEIIVVDDCSTDQSREVAARYPVRLLQTPRNSGHATARNIGIDAAQGEWIAWLDADDRWQPHHICTLMKHLGTYPQAAVAFSAVRKFGDCQGVWQYVRDGEPCGDVFWDCYRATVVPAMAVVTRSDAVREVGGFDQAIRIAPDFEFWLRMAQKYQFCWTTEVTADYRWHASQISSQPFKQKVSLYSVRHRVWKGLAKQGNVAQAERAKQSIMELWETEVNEAWVKGRRERLKQLMKLKKFVPEHTDFTRWVAKRLLLPNWPSPWWTQFDQTLDRVRVSFGLHP